MEKLAAKGDARAIAALDGPEFPDCLDYLYRWAVDMHGRSGVGMGGLMPLSYSTIADYSRLNDIYIAPHEVAALILLDSVMLSPGED